MSNILPEKMLTPQQVADIFAVDPKTVTRWAQAGKIPCIRTLGGHRRFKQSVIEKLVAESTDSGS
jgi:excisionase family DNA binding protein